MAECVSCGWPGEGQTRLSHTLWNIRRGTFEREAEAAENRRVMEAAVETDPEKIAAFKRLFPAAETYTVA